MGLHLGNTVILSSYQTRWLGMVFHKSFGCSQSFQSIKAKRYSIAATLSRLHKAGVPSESLLRFYKALFAPAITYAISSWGNASALHLYRLETAQHDAVRAILNLSRRSRVPSSMVNNNIMSVKHLFCFPRRVRNVRGRVHAW